jgi:hypothetical protein
VGVFHRGFVFCLRLERAPRLGWVRTHPVGDPHPPTSRSLIRNTRVNGSAVAPAPHYWKWLGSPSTLSLRFMARKKKKSSVALWILAAVLVAAVLTGVFLFQARRARSLPMSRASQVRRSRLRNSAISSACPRLILWPALRNLENGLSRARKASPRQSNLRIHKSAER